MPSPNSRFQTYFNTKIFWRVFLVLVILESCFVLTGCTAAWIVAVKGLLPSISALADAILAFVAALEGKTVSAAVYAAVQKWQQNLSTAITDVEEIIAAIQSNTSSGLISQFQAAMQVILQQFSSLLSTVDITDSSTVAKLTQLVALGIAAINAVLALIPIVLQKLAAKAPNSELRQYDKTAAAATNNAVTIMKETYVTIVTTPTENMDVNSALESIPQTI